MKEWDTMVAMGFVAFFWRLVCVRAWAVGCKGGGDRSIDRSKGRLRHAIGSIDRSSTNHIDPNAVLPLRAPSASGLDAIDRSRAGAGV